MAFGAVYAVGGVGAVPGGRAGCELVVLVRSVLLGETPMRASPAEYNSALRRGQASLLLVT